MRKSKHERNLMKQRQDFCGYLVDLGRFFKNKITNYVYRCNCSYCQNGKELKKKKADLDFKEQKDVYRTE